MSEALRNVIMQHNDPRTFVRHYLPRRVNVDLQAIVRGLEPQAEVMQASCRMLRSLDRRRPYKLTAEQSKSVNQDPRVLRLERRRDRHRGRPTRQEESRRVERDLRNLKQRLRAKLRRNIRESWDREQAIKDIQHQLAGGSFEDIREQHLGSVERTPEHKRLITALMSLPGATLEEEMQRRNEAINAVAAYCHLEESYRPNQPGGCRLDTVPPAKMDPERETADLIEKILKAAKCMVFANEQNKRPLKCFVCFGDTNKSWHQRVYDFARPGDLSKHFKKYHLTHLEANATIKCEVCNITLGHRKHFQRHALATHGTVS
ncbi:hypothetical protein L228DRAFT_246970 [Xylona heveae TC161]|uniref:C2H2-type domain-containing protein n=1 Tax=Xylona heveae (strain CBS 132557 / TC161) TaxID=1328760 RepID=A0A165GUU9_XYLHT|nr:hypothetical protein L228DRAFT_246970 [Xylona heveae TC161]KZF22622.1 hypothetical protein L228DRAFT_246970 [Xylona heveae TC161]